MKRPIYTILRMYDYPTVIDVAFSLREAKDIVKDCVMGLADWKPELWVYDDDKDEWSYQDEETDDNYFVQIFSKEAVTA